MSAETHTRNMFLRLVGLLSVVAPTELESALKRFGFEPGDVTIRYPEHPIVEVKRWPWERARDPVAAAVSCQGPTQWAPDNVQCKRCGLHGQRCAAFELKEGDSP